MAFVKAVDLSADEDEAFYELVSLRAEIGIQYLLNGLNLDEERATELLSAEDDNNLTQQDRDIRDRLIAGIDNIVEFSVCEEYQAINDIPEDFDMDDPEDMERLEEISDTYHLRYAAVENADIQYAAEIAYKWAVLWSAATWVTYMTMNDDRVRPWHRQLEGYSAPRDMFPEWMIPPIEWGCRCYLEDQAGNSVQNKAIQDVLSKAPDKPKQIDGVFSESLAKCGRIFSKSHPYFKVKPEHKEKLSGYVERLKQYYHAS